MSIDESSDVTRIYSVADQLPAGTPLIRHRPFRSPHHTISHAGLVYDYAVARDPSLADKVHVIHTSPPFGIPPVVVNPDIRPQVKLQLQTILLEMQNDPQGLAALQAIGVDRFVQVDDPIYDSVRSLLGEVTLSPLP